jgi:ribosomal protein S18 acetylase RimI-like enzyme
MKIEDYFDVINLWKESKLPFKPKGRDSYNNIKFELEKDTSIFLLLENNNKIIGSIFGTHDGRKGWINRLAISPKFQRKGLATKLCLNLESIFLKMNINIISCLIEEYNANSLIFFRKIGYIKHDDIYYLSKRKNEDI